MKKFLDFIELIEPLIGWGKDRPEWESFVKREADTCKSVPSVQRVSALPSADDYISGYHPAGTCKMGNDDDQMAVVDAQLRVRGVDNLRVVDASIMPTLMGGHPQVAVYAIAEKAADMIKRFAQAPA
ncbi:hypothetical protein HO133_004730 [Letharia lupina]|uniref:Glucose-methanol-choline oxidoreductase C-terminal domain-containing protein n=1 Tax=Letharia lupina TaxID=560253 RepID=A0A8H6FKX1_9LECA|nr:uncharacterized protein HO133_004730 [Letharia lupina]KAF6230388.1 hypothetical protein HO133_004730 [Letharia lupina]